MSGEWYEVELLQTDGSWKPLQGYDGVSVFEDFDGAKAIAMCVFITPTRIVIVRADGSREVVG